MINSAVRPALFNDFNDVDMLEDMPPVQSWDVMDQFPPNNSHDQGGGLVLKKFYTEAVSPSHEVGLEAGPRTPRSIPSSTSPRNVMEIVLQYAGIPITKGDLQRLEPGIFLNDNLISFGLKVWLDALEISHPILFSKIHIFSTFFYKKLSSGETLQNGYDQVCKWAKCDIFSKKYLIVPINEDCHWYLAIVYEPEHMISIKHNSAESIDNTPRTYIFTFDSLGGQHTRTWEWLSAYLEMEAKYKKGIDQPCKAYGRNAVVPLQPNFCDCGIYLLHYMQTFLSDPIKYADMIVSPLPEYKKYEMRRALWLVNLDDNFERNRRNELRQIIEGLSIDWKSNSNCSPIQSRDGNESAGEVEVVDFRDSKMMADKTARNSQNRSQPQDDDDSEGEVEFVCNIEDAATNVH